MKIYLLLFSIFVWADRPNLLLLKTYTDQNITGWVMSEKLDGIRAYWNGTNLISRGGKIIYAPVWFTKDYPSFEIDGELWSRRGDFDNISSIVRDKIPSEDWTQIKHYIFEVPNAKGNLYQRLEKVKPYQSKIIKVLKQIQIKDTNHLNIFLSDIESKDGEGVVVRDPQSPYIDKRTSKALKVKTFHDTECIVIGYTKGRGKYRDMVGALRCRLVNGIEFKIGSGLTNIQRQTPPLIGDTVSFRYQEFTKNGKPRFPTFLRIRK